MRITRTKVETVVLPLRVTFRTALRQTNQVTDIRVTLETDTGLAGFGSAAPTPAITGETTESIVSALNNYILPSLTGIDLEDEETVFRVLHSSLVRNPSAKAAADIALHDLYSKQRKQPLAVYLGGLLETVTTDSTVSLDTVNAMVTQARQLAESGFSVLKVKLGGKDGLDEERIRQIRSAVGQNMILRVDANQAWTASEGIRYIAEMEEYDVQLIEQPVPAYDVKGLAQISKATSIPIAADESIYDWHDLKRIIEEHAADIVNIKLMKCGGLFAAKQMIRQARQAGLDFMVGSMMEGPVSVAAATHLCSAAGCHYVDLDAAYFLEEARASGGIRYDGAAMMLPNQPGIGVAWL